jgi:hypothetical protein
VRVHVAFADVSEHHAYGARLLVPNMASVDLGSIVLATAALVAMRRYGIGLLTVIGISAAVGMADFLLVWVRPTRKTRPGACCGRPSCRTLRAARHSNQSLKRQIVGTRRWQRQRQGHGHESIDGIGSMTGSESIGVTYNAGCDTA